MLVGLAIWIAAAFSTALDCRIQGDLYTMPDAPPSLTRTDGCRMIQTREESGVLVLRSTHIRVEIVPPSTGGHQAFSYRWGSGQAWIAGQSWPIAWSYVVTG